MNKVILTHDRLFMSIEGPSDCGKTELLFRMLKGSTFYPRFEKIYSFYKEFRTLFKDKQRVIPEIEFLKHSGFDITKNLSNCLPIYDNSCEEIFNIKEFVKLAISGRHRKLHVIYVKHNLFHQSKCSRTTDRKTTHILLLKSLREIQQIENLGKQLNYLQLIKEADKVATAELIGQLMINLDPKISQGLQFLSQLIGPDPSFFIFSPLKQSLQHSQMKKKHLLMLKQWAKNRNENTAQMKTSHQDDFIWFLSDCVMNVLSGVVPVNKVEFKKNEKPPRTLTDRRVEKKVRETKLFDQIQGIRLIILIALPCIVFLEQNAH